MKNSKAFTLAEILITLSIIGVVAALTIPTLIQRTGNEESVSRLQKAYSTLSQATEAIMTEQGSPNVWASNNDNIYNAYKEHLRSAKSCGSNTGCFTRSGGILKLDGTRDSSWNADHSGFHDLILSDGVSVSFHYASQNCDTATGYPLGLTDLCAWMWVDINGSKKPNQIGRDIFTFGLKKSGLYPGGVDSVNNTDTCNPKGNTTASQYGYGCAARIISEGDMNY